MTTTSGPHYRANAMGVEYDPEEMLARLRAGNTRIRTADPQSRCSHLALSGFAQHMIRHLKQGKSVAAKAAIDTQVRTTVETIIADIEQRWRSGAANIRRNSINGEPARYDSPSEIKTCIRR